MNHTTWSTKTASFSTSLYKPAYFEHLCVPFCVIFKNFDCTQILDSEDGTVIASYCGSGIPDPLTSSGSILYIRLISTSYAIGNRFRASWSTGTMLNFTHNNEKTQLLLQMRYIRTWILETHSKEYYVCVCVCVCVLLGIVCVHAHDPVCMYVCMCVCIITLCINVLIMYYYSVVFFS